MFSSNFIRPGHFVLDIFTDVFLMGWGAKCGEIRTHGFLSLDKQTYNYLKLLATFHALRCFVSHLRRCEILLRAMDNTTALSYIIRMGSVKFPLLLNFTQEIWSWCADRDSFIYASYISSTQNTEADVSYVSFQRKRSGPWVKAALTESTLTLVLSISTYSIVEGPR